MEHDWNLAVEKIRAINENTDVLYFMLHCPGMDGLFSIQQDADGKDKIKCLAIDYKSIIGKLDDLEKTLDMSKNHVILGEEQNEKNQ
jgi:hypothetical protein